MPFGKVCAETDEAPKRQNNDATTPLSGRVSFIIKYYPDCAFPSGRVIEHTKRTYRVSPNPLVVKVRSEAAREGTGLFVRAGLGT
jgi:hypothetical protein